MAEAAGRQRLEAYVGFCLRFFGPTARRAAERNGKLRHALEQAHLGFLPDAFLAFAWMNTFLSVLLGYALVFLGVGAWDLLGDGPSLPVAAVLLVLPLLVGASLYVAQAVYPDYRAGERRRLIDRDLPYAVNYIAAMSSAGIVPTLLLRDLARETTYGEVSREVAWMVRDIDLLGLDLLTSINRAIARTPSLRFQEFLQGAKTTILSGGDLKTYFAAKAEQYMGENRRVQKEFLDGLGIMAESYVTVVIAGPLFMLVLLSIMVLLGRGTESSMAFLFMLVFLALPLAHSAFSWVIKNMAPEA
ncbi:MAG TPA: type II secretion system F family protein [Candidatus Thermoplasmatota archaeon]|nr:type II secretion system F family protein [Candidatus Thermoplasmatota archaeon]